MLDSNQAHDETSLDSFLALARFADQQYQGIVTHMKSSTFEAKQALVKKAKEDLDALATLGDKPTNK